MLFLNTNSLKIHVYLMLNVCIMLLIHPVTHSLTYVFVTSLHARAESSSLAGGSFLELDHHHGDVVWTAAVERLKDDALRTKVRFMKTLFNEMHGFLVAEGVPESI